MSVFSDKREAWSAHVADFSASGLTRREWCERKGLPLYKLRYWLRELRPRPQRCVPVPPAGEETTGWAAVEIVEDTALRHKLEASSGCLSICIGAARIEVQPGLDPALLSDVLRAVVAVC